MGSEDNVSVLLGDPRKAIRSMVVPLLVSLLVVEVNTMADRAWCSGLGPDALAAIAVVTPIYMVITGLGNGLGVGAASMVARRIGAGDRASAEVCVRQTMLFAIVFGLLLTPLLYLSMWPILDVIGSPDINSLAAEYMGAIVLSSTVFIVSGAMAGLLRGEGGARMATWMVSLTAVCNIVLDPILIYGFGMGVTGAAVATSVSTLLSIAFGLYLYGSRMTYLRMDVRGGVNRVQMRAVLSMGVPQMMEYTVMYAMNIVLNYLVLYCAGSEGLTVYSVPNLIVGLAVIPAMAIGSSLVPVASSAYGQGDMGRIADAYRYSLTVALASTAAIALVAMLLPEQLLFVFTYSPETEALRPMMAEALRIYALYIPLFAFIPVGSSLLQALGRPNRSVVLAVVRNLILIALYAVAAQHSLYWIYWAVVVGELVGGLMMYAVAGRTFAAVRGSGSPGSG